MSREPNARQPSPRRISLPAALFVTGIALSCSTACITNAVVGTIQRENALNAASDELAQNIRNRTGGRGDAAVAADPLAIAQALRQALPVRKYGRAGIDADTVDVKRERYPDGRDHYLITVCGDFFEFGYAEAFVHYADQLRLRLEPTPVFALDVKRTESGRSWMVLERQLK